MPCFSCGRGFHKFCIDRCDKCHPAIGTVAGLEKGGSLEVGDGTADKIYKDPLSTGRKQAAQLYPIDKKNPEPCEWQGKKNCGGGKVPIHGCVSGQGIHRHHGPIKNTLHNEMGNVHRICTSCHNHWHELNDWQYDETEFKSLSHAPETATQEELEEVAKWWKNGKMRTIYTMTSQVKAKERAGVDKKSIEVYNDGDSEERPPVAENNSEKRKLLSWVKPSKKVEE